MRNEAQLSDKSFIPISWVWAILGVAGSCFIISIGAIFSLSGALTHNSEAQVALNARVSLIENDRGMRIQKYEELQRSNAERLASIETKVDLLLRKFK